jgi:hypothetical protein
MTENEIDICPYHLQFDKLNAFEKYFITQLQLLKELIESIKKSDMPDRLDCLGQLLVSLISNGEAVKILLHGAYVPEAYIIARAFLEKCVNFCYLNICEQCEYDNYLDWTQQKIIRTIYTKQKTFKNVGSDLFPSPDINSFTKGKDKIKKFSGKKGGEKFAWTSVSLYHRIKFLEGAIGKKSLGMYLATMNLIYEDASENIHGTLYGATYHKIYFYDADVTEEDKMKRQLIMMSEMYMFLGCLIHGIFEILSKKIPDNSILKQSEENINEVIRCHDEIEKKYSGKTSAEEDIGIDAKKKVEVK